MLISKVVIHPFFILKIKIHICFVAVVGLKIDKFFWLIWHYLTFAGLIYYSFSLFLFTGLTVTPRCGTCHPGTFSIGTSVLYITHYCISSPTIIFKISTTPMRVLFKKFRPDPNLFFGIRTPKRNTWICCIRIQLFFVKHQMTANVSIIFSPHI